MKTTFRKLLFFQMISRFSNAVLCFVLLVWLLQQTGSAALYGSVTALAVVPMLLGVLFGGTLADRCRRQRLLSVLDITTAFGMLAAAALVGTVQVLPFVSCTLCILYAAEGIAQPTAQACIPVLLHGTALEKGNAAFQFCTALAEMLGTLLGNLFFSVLGLRGLLLFCGGLFITASVGEFVLVIPYRPVKHTAPAEQHFTFSRALVPIAAILALLNLAVVPAFTVGVPILIIQVLSLPDSALALTQSAMHVGSLLGWLTAAAVAKQPVPHGRSASLWCITALCVLLGLSVLPQFPADFAYILITLAALFMMAAAAVFQIQLNAFLQTLVPAEQVGRAISGFTVAACLPQPVGQALFGLAYEKAAAFPALVPLTAAVASFFIAVAAVRYFRKKSHFTNS